MNNLKSLEAKIYKALKEVEPIYGFDNRPKHLEIGQLELALFRIELANRLITVDFEAKDFSGTLNADTWIGIRLIESVNPGIQFLHKFDPITYECVYQGPRFDILGDLKKPRKLRVDKSHGEAFDLMMGAAEMARTIALEGRKKKP